jgi:hypothetical protein
MLMAASTAATSTSSLMTTPICCRKASNNQDALEGYLRALASSGKPLASGSKVARSSPQHQRHRTQVVRHNGQRHCSPRADPNDPRLRQRTEEEIKRRNPRWIAPIVVWLASEESADVTGRVFEAGDGILKVAEGWYAGPGTEPVEDPNELGPKVAELIKKARPNADIWGRDIVS